MSFILDALRKSELERQRQSGPSIAELPAARDDRRLPMALLAIGLLLALNVSVLLWFLLRDHAPAAATPIATAASPEAAPAPARAPASAAPPPPATAPGPRPAVGDAPRAAGAPPPVTDAYPEPTLLPEASTAPPAAFAWDDAVPPVDALPPQATAGLPALAIDLHVYADERAKRAVFINGRRYQEGGTLAEGPVVEEITRDGAVLNHRGRRFLLPRN